MERPPLACAVSLAFSSLAACTAMLDVNDYEFAAGGSAGQDTASPALPLTPDQNAGGMSTDVPLPSSPPGRDVVAVTLPPERPRPEAPPPPDAGAPDATLPEEPPPEEPPPVQPLPRPVLVAAPEPLAQLAGSATGGDPRAANCPDGVIYGLYFQSYTSLHIQPDRLSYVWPMCNRLEPGTPNLKDGEIYAVNWIVSSPDDPVFAPLRENELFDGIACPVDQYVVGVEGTYDDLPPSIGFRSLAVRCAPLNTDAERVSVVHGPSGYAIASGISPVAGAFSFVQSCPDGQAAHQLELRFGDWLDAVGLRCSAVRWPFTAGHACAAGSECQSGACGVDGTCVP